MQLPNILAFAADKLGYEASPKYMGNARPMAQRLRQLFDLYGIERVIDVGGNRGQCRSFLRFDMGFSGPILSVEPDPEMVAAMRQKAAALGDAQWTVMPCALGRTFVKMDIQGFGLEVLGGGPLAFAQAPLVQTEVSFKPIYPASPGWVESVQAFEAAGFQLADLFVLQDSVKHGLPLEADCILARPRVMA